MSGGMENCNECGQEGSRCSCWRKDLYRPRSCSGCGASDDKKCMCSTYTNETDDATSFVASLLSRPNESKSLHCNLCGKQSTDCRCFLPERRTVEPLLKEKRESHEAALIAEQEMLKRLHIEKEVQAKTIVSDKDLLATSGVLNTSGMPCPACGCYMLPTPGKPGQYECKLCQEVEKKLVDSVNHPKHYNSGKFEVIDVIEDWKLGFNLGNSVKYIARCEHKGNKLEDLEKARWYLDREIARVKKEKKT